MTVNWEMQFADLHRQWSVIEPDSGQIAEEVTWSSQFDTLRVEFNNLIQRNVWVRGSKDFLSIIGLARSELHHCSLIAWLLDPLGSHGLGDQFLAEILADCFPEETFDDLVFSHVTTEVTSADTRADIIVYGVAWTLVVEAKVNADEGYRQCDRLFREFSPHVNSRFVFLTPNGGRPRTATGDAARAFVPLGFQRLRFLLEAAIEQRTPDPLVENYLITLSKEFG